MMMTTLPCLSLCTLGLQYFLHKNLWTYVYKHCNYIKELWQLLTGREGWTQLYRLTWMRRPLGRPSCVGGSTPWREAACVPLILVVSCITFSPTPSFTRTPNKSASTAAGSASHEAHLLRLNVQNLAGPHLLPVSLTAVFLTPQVGAGGHGSHRTDKRNIVYAWRVLTAPLRGAPQPVTASGRSSNKHPRHSVDDRMTMPETGAATVSCSTQRPGGVVTPPLTLPPQGYNSSSTPCQEVRRDASDRNSPGLHPFPEHLFSSSTL